MRAAISIGVYNVFRGLAVGGYMTLFPMYMKSLGYSMESIGGVIAASSLAAAAILPAIGVYIDRMGPRIWVIITGALQATGIAIVVVETSIYGLVASYFLFLMSFLAGQPSRMSFLARSISLARLGTYVGITSSVFSASRLVGPSASGYIAGSLSFREAFELLAATSTVGLLLFTVLSAGVKLGGVEKPRSVLEAYKSQLRPQGGMRGLLAFIGADRFSWALWFQLLTAHLYANGYSEFESGLAITVSGVAQTLLLPAAGRIVDRFGASASLAASEALGAVSAVLLASAGRLEVYTAMVILGVSIAFWVPAYNTIIAKFTGGGGTGYTTANTVRSLSGAPSPYLGGYIYDAVSPLAPFLASAALLAGLSLAAATRLRSLERRARRSEAPGEPLRIPEPPLPAERR